MKKIIFLIITVVYTQSVFATNLKSEVNECFELTSIVFRLAGADEYINNDIKQYSDDIDRYFAEFSNHSLIDFVRNARQQYAIGYDAVTSITALLDIKNGKVTVAKGVKASGISDIDERWNEDTFRKFVILLNDFYRQSEFNSFYNQHQALYETAEQRMDILLQQINVDWFQSFFGEKLKNPRIILSLCNGRSNYAILSSSNNYDYGIVIGCSADGNGLPFYKDIMLYTIIHELNHNFTNRRFDQFWDLTESSALKIYPYVKEKMRENAYGSVYTSLLEWLNNLFSLMYFRENPIDDLPEDFLVVLEQGKGFIWMERSVNFMNHFYNNRDVYPNIDDYISQIVCFINFTGDNFGQILNEYNQRHPYIVDMYPVSNNKAAINFDTIEIKFSEPMNACHGLRQVNDDYITIFPISGMSEWKDEYTFAIPIDKSALQKGKVYGLVMPYEMFQSKRYYNIENDFVYTIQIEE